MPSRVALTGPGQTAGTRCRLCSGGRRCGGLRSGGWAVAARAVEVGHLLGDALVGLLLAAHGVDPGAVVEPALDGDAPALVKPLGVVLASGAEADDVEEVGAFAGSVDGDAVPADSGVLRDGALRVGGEPAD